MTNTNGYPDQRLGYEEYVLGSRAHIGAARAASAAALASARHELEQKRPFDIGPGGVTSLTEGLKAVSGHVVIEPGRKRVVGSGSPHDSSIAQLDAAQFAPQGNPSDVLKLRAVVLEGDQATGVVTREKGEGQNRTFDVSLVRLGVGEENPERDGYTGRLIGQRSDLRLAPEKPGMLGTDTHYVDGVSFSVGFRDGQITVEPGGTQGLAVMTAAEANLTPGAEDFAGRLARNPSMWNPASANHHRVAGMV